MTALSALAAAAIAPPRDVAMPPALEACIRQACAGAWRAIEVVFAGDVLRSRISKTRDSIVRDAVEGVLGLFGNVGIRADALAALRAARDAGALDGPIDLGAVVAEISTHGAVAIGRAAMTEIRRSLAAFPDLEAAFGDHDLASLLIDTARACFRAAARDPLLAAWAIGPTGSPGRDRALAAFGELAASPDSIAELESLIALPIHLDDNVQFTVYRPRAIDPGKWHQLLAFAHLADRRPGEDDLPDPVEEVQRQAASVLGAKAHHYQPVVQDAGAAIPEEGELTFVPELPGIEVNPPRRSFLWLESVHREEFRIRAPQALNGKTIRGRLTVFLGHIAIAEVAISVRVDAARPEPRAREPQHARAYRKIFASYSHRDIDIVNQFETYARALGDEYLRDWVHLRTGEVWTDRLCQLISQADAFQLFWSNNSMRSQFVRQEYEYALSLNRASFVRPTYWEEPMPTAPGLPPETLLRLHFQKLGAETMTVGAGSRAKQSKKRAEPDAVERERAPDVSDTKLTVIDAESADLDPADSFSDTRNDVRALEDHDRADTDVGMPRSTTAPLARRSTTAPGAGVQKEEAKRAPATPVSRARAPRPMESMPSPSKLDEDSIDTPVDPSIDAVHYEPVPSPGSSRPAAMPAPAPAANRPAPSSPASSRPAPEPSTSKPASRPAPGRQPETPSPASMSGPRPSPSPSVIPPIGPPRPAPGPSALPPSMPRPAPGPSMPPGPPRPAPGPSAPPPSQPTHVRGNARPSAGSILPPGPPSRPSPASIPPSRPSPASIPPVDKKRGEPPMPEQPRPPLAQPEQRQVASSPSSPSVDSWNDEGPARTSDATLFPPSPPGRPSRPSQAPIPSAPRLFPEPIVEAGAPIEPMDPLTTTQPGSGLRPRTPSQPTTLAGIRADELSRSQPFVTPPEIARPSQPIEAEAGRRSSATIPPAVQPVSPSWAPNDDEPPASWAAAAPSPWAAPAGGAPPSAWSAGPPPHEPPSSTIPPPRGSVTASMAVPAMPEPAPPSVAPAKPFKSNVSPYAPTMPHTAYQDDPAPAAAAPSSADSTGPTTKRLPDAPAARGWVLAVLVTLIVVAIVIVLVFVV